MGDVSVKILEPFEGYPNGTEGDFLTLAEAKMLLGISTAPDPVGDDLLKLQISMASADIMRLCNHVFARERLVETWYGLQAPTVFLTHWPVVETDIEDIDGGGAGVFDLEEMSGKLMGFGGFGSPVSITYTGGYLLPDEAPLPLKRATALLVGDSRTQASRDAVEGIKMIAHKESRVIYFDPNTASTAKTSTSSGSSSGNLKVDAMLSRYMRLWA
jgi:hypothetical protein